VLAAQISTAEVIAIAAGAAAVVALAGLLALTIALRRTRAAQRRILGDHGTRDLVDHAASLDDAFRVLREYVEDVGGRLDGRLASAEQRIDGAIAHRALIRYDAYNEMSGQQSLTIALLDANRSGVLITSIHHRDQARLYAKQVTGGAAELKLSPEEEEALRRALAG
jgi:hypothetical protein